MVNASEIAAFLGEPLLGPEVSVERPRPLSDPAPHSLLFAKKFRPDWVEVLNGVENSLVLACAEYAGHLRVSHILVASPRLAVARVLRKFFAPPAPSGIASDAVVDPSARLGRGVSIGHYSVIGEDVEIGDETVVAHHVVIAAGVRIGCRCLVKSHAVIGEEGFGIEFDEDDRPLRVPHIGGVKIGDDVEVGTHCAIARGTLGDTVIENHVKLDDHVHVSHNCRIGAATLVTPSAEICGSVQIGKRAWIGPNAVINTGVKIADRTLVGVGAAVLRPSRPGQHLFGNPARPVELIGGEQDS
jgi:UDP-3-O-[3-hydroxymyristoyl] glucosamine N-acyltransferase